MQRVTILSPHRDDAAFSLYLWLKRWVNSGVHVRVLNFFTVSAYGPRGPAKSADAVSRVRMIEDRRALSLIGKSIRVRDCDLLDAPLRLRIKPEAVCRPETYVLAAGSESEIKTLIERHAGLDLLVAPLATGGHVDHRLVLRAAIACSRNHRLAFYEDLPYAAWTPAPALARCIGDMETATRVRLTPVLTRLQGAVCQKQNVIAQYRSQISAQEAALIARYSIRYGGGERLWIPKRSRAWALLMN